MKKLQVIQNKIVWNIYEGDRFTSNTSIHITLDGRTLTEEIESASTKLYQRIKQHDNPIIAALGNYNIHMHYSYTKPKQTIH
jgi:hypothetical protein